MTTSSSVTPNDTGVLKLRCAWDSIMLRMEFRSSQLAHFSSHSVNPPSRAYALSRFTAEEDTAEFLLVRTKFIFRNGSLMLPYCSLLAPFVIVISLLLPEFLRKWWRISTMCLLLDVVSEHFANAFDPRCPLTSYSPRVFCDWAPTQTEHIV